jgi:glycolate oxidase FAD binding subunit
MEKESGEAARIDAAAPPWWGRLPTPPGAPGHEAESPYLLLEVRNVASRLPGSFVAPFAAAEDVETHAAVRGSLASGVFHVTLPPGTGAATAAGFVSGLRAGIEDAGRVVVLAAPEEIGRRVDRWGHVGALKLMRRVKERFDPDRRMSPGRFVGGI